MEISRSGRAACYPDLTRGRARMFQVPEKRDGPLGLTRARGEATEEALKGQEDSSRLSRAGADSTRGQAGAAGDPGHSAWLLFNRPAR